MGEFSAKENAGTIADSSLGFWGAKLCGFHKTYTSNQSIQKVELCI